MQRKYNNFKVKYRTEKNTIKRSKDNIKKELQRFEEGREADVHFIIIIIMSCGPRGYP